MDTCHLVLYSSFVFCSCINCRRYPITLPKATREICYVLEVCQVHCTPSRFCVTCYPLAICGTGFLLRRYRLQRKFERAVFHEMSNCLSPLPFLLVFTGDYCQDPNNNLASISYLEDQQDYLRYYSTCEDETELTSLLELAKNSTIIIAQHIVEPALDFIYGNEILLESCPTENLIELGEKAALSVIGSYILLVLTSAITSCATINPLYAEIVYSSGM